MDLKDILEKKLFKMKGVAGLKKIQGEASNRAFFRIFLKNDSLVAMVYPRENSEEIQKIIRLTRLYQKHNINVPEIKEILDDRIVILQDLGNLSVQRLFLTSPKQKRLSFLEKIAGLLIKIKNIDPLASQSALDSTRMKWEMDFFLKYFISYFGPASINHEKLKKSLHALVDHLEGPTIFAHRDFHSRNMQVYNNKIYLVDFQDSLRAPIYYDLASFVYDSYLDLKSTRDYFLKCLLHKHPAINQEQFYLTALQRNIKALGTFGFQVNIRQNLSYKKYINRTIGYIVNNRFCHQFLNGSVFDFFISNFPQNWNR